MTTGKIDGKRSRGRQREKILDSMTVMLQKDKPIQTISCTWNRERWRSMDLMSVIQERETCIGAAIITAIESGRAWGLEKLARANPSTFDVFQGTLKTVKTKGGNCLTS